MKEELTSTGGRQAVIEGMFTLIPPYALAEVSKTMKEGSKYGIENWHKIPVKAKQHGDSIDTGELDHAMEHYCNFMVGHGDKLEELTHCAARILMALDQFIRESKRLEESFENAQKSFPGQVIEYDATG